MTLRNDIKYLQIKLSNNYESFSSTLTNVDHYKTGHIKIKNIEIQKVWETQTIQQTIQKNQKLFFKQQFTFFGIRTDANLNFEDYINPNAKI